MLSYFFNVRAQGHVLIKNDSIISHNVTGGQGNAI